LKEKKYALKLKFTIFEILHTIKTLGCLKLTYRTNDTALKVAYSSYKKTQNNRAECYRHGFNGKENDNEVKGTGNSVDFGARIYDSRLGRFLSVDPLFKEYPNISPYAFVANSPIRFIDYDGRHIRDANGNIVYSKRDAVPDVVPYKSGKLDVLIIYEAVWIYANDGSKHEAWLTSIKTVDGKDVTNLSNRLTYDCHGHTQTEGKFFIDSDEPIEGLLKSDRFGKMEEDKNINNAVKGDILVFRLNNKIGHTAICNDDEECSAESKNGWRAPLVEKENIDDLKKAYGNLTVVKPVENRKLEKLNKKGENGIAEYSEAEVKEAFDASDEKETKPK
jgi:RHS repeat-associated protein